MAFVLSSPAFSTGQVIPAKYTCDGENPLAASAMVRRASRYPELRVDH
jgi:hypothetical protein